MRKTDSIGRVRTTPQEQQAAEENADAKNNVQAATVVAHTDLDDESDDNDESPIEEATASASLRCDGVRTSIDLTAVV